MNANILEAYMEKVYRYAVKQTFSWEEAEELSQEILFTALRSLVNLREEDRFEPWLWGIARNVTKVFRRSMGKQRAMYSYGMLYEEPVFEEPEEDNESVYASLRGKIAMLSTIYRDIVILYYYDGLTTEQIADRLHIPKGTVTWRLSEARNKLKKEYDDMEETALRPIQMKLDIYGSGNYNGTTVPYPSEYINDALSQNIFYYCYESPKTIEELSRLTGIPAFYIEDCMKNLIRREAVIQLPKGRYQTDFIIWTDKYGIYCEENAEHILLPMMERLLSAIKAIEKDAKEIDFYRADKSDQELFYLYGIMAFVHMSQKYSKLPYPAIEPQYDGYCWRYVANMESGSHHRTGVAIQASINQQSRGSYGHFVYGFTGFGFRMFMFDYEINVCEDILTTGEVQDRDSAAKAICKGYIVRKEDGSLFVTVPAFTKDQYKQFEMIAERHMGPLVEEYSQLVEKFIAGYKKLFPKHLQADADRMCQGFFVGMYDAIVSYGQRTGILEKPMAGSICDVLIQNS